MGFPSKIPFDGGYEMRLPYDLKSLLCPLLEKPAYEYNISCPLHFVTFSNFKQTLKESGYRMIGDENILFNRDGQDFVYIDGEGDKHRYLVEVFTTLSFEEIEGFFAKAIKQEFKNKYVLIQGVSCKVFEKFNTPDFDEIKPNVPSDVLSVLEGSLWNYEEFCSKYSKYRFSNTLGILLYGQPGIGKTFVLRSYLNKLVLERNFTIVQLYQNALRNLNISVLLDSCKYLFPCILFIEDIDIQFKDRNEVSSSLASQILETFEGLSQAKEVVLIATSNNVNVVEKAMLRPGRIDYLLDMDKPSRNVKESVLLKYISELDISFPEHLIDTMVNNVDTFAELNGAYQHVIRSYLSTGEFPSPEEIATMSRTWKETRITGLPETKVRKVGLV
jgi:ATPase family associated with various cellular activities (AAA)